jgi:uncharacterized protein (DUF1778 family)
MQTTMPCTSAKKPVADDRITARIPHAKRIIIEKAAAVYGASLNQFLVQTALDRASKILEREETMRLSEQDARSFLTALDNPPEPSAKLVAALQAHAQLVKC